MFLDQIHVMKNKSEVYGVYEGKNSDISVSQVMIKLGIWITILGFF